MRVGSRPFRAVALAAICLVGGACAAARSASAPAAATTVVVVRHAERPSDSGSDPGLSAEGEARAQALVRALAGAEVAAVYTTQYRRTRDTGATLAEAVGVEVTVRPIDAGNAARHASDLAAEVIAKHRGETVVVVGHSNTVPDLVAAFGGAEPEEIAESEYDRLYLLVVDGGGVRSVAVRYGRPTD